MVLNQSNISMTVSVTFLFILFNLAPSLDRITWTKNPSCDRKYRYGPKMINCCWLKNPMEIDRLTTTVATVPISISSFSENHQIIVMSENYFSSKTLIFGHCLSVQTRGRLKKD